MSTADVVIIDSGGANLASLVFALERLEARAAVTSDPQTIRAARRVILPGVGSAQDAMRRLQASGIAEVLPQLQQPLLGICLGMQLLFNRSEEGEVDCLGIIPGAVRRLRPAAGHPVPHMGWNTLSRRRDDALLEHIEDHDYVYFVHSYAVSPSSATLATTDYGTEFSAVVRAGNFFGTQFHPERSAGAGARLLANFLRLH